MLSRMGTETSPLTSWEQTYGLPTPWTRMGRCQANLCVAWLSCGHRFRKGPVTSSHFYWRLWLCLIKLLSQQDINLTKKGKWDLTGCYGDNCAANSRHVDTAEHTVLMRPGESCPECMQSQKLVHNQYNPDKCESHRLSETKILSLILLWLLFIHFFLCLLHLRQGCRLGRAAGEARLQPFPQETPERNAKAPAAHRQRGVRFGSSLSPCVTVTVWPLMVDCPAVSPWWFHSSRMSKFEEDDGIDMNDIERFLPHLRSVSTCIFFLHTPHSDVMCW